MHNERVDRPAAQRPMSPLAQAAYYGTAVVAAVILAFDLIASPFDIVVLLALGLLATWIRYRAAGRDSLGSSLSWAGVFFVAWLALAWLANGWPFGPA